MNIRIIKKPVGIHKALMTFSGWPDAGKLIEHTLGELKKGVAHELAATWDLDGFWLNSVTRPQVSVQHGQIQRLEWPSYQFFLVYPTSSAPFILGNGPEPSSNWHGFTRELLDLLRQWHCEEVFLLGSLYDQVFHDEVVISSVVQDPRSYNRVQELGCQRIDYVGPGAIHSAIMEAAQAMKIHCLSFWAHLPFYLNEPHELLMTQMLHLLEQLLGITLNTRHLAESWEKRAKEIENLLEQDSELRHLLESIKKKSLSAHFPSPSRKVVRLDEFIRKKHDPTQEKE